MKNKTYVIIREKGKFDRENAIRAIQNLRAIKHLTAQLINTVVKSSNDGNDIYNLTRLVKRAKEDYKYCWKEEMVYIQRINDPEIKKIRGDSLADTLSDLKDAIRHKRHMAKENNIYRVDRHVHNSFGYWMKKQMDKVYFSLTEGKSPKDKERYLGIEIECIIPTNSDLQKLMLPYVKYVSLASDGSIDAREFNISADCDCEDPDNCENTHESENYEGKEIRVLVKESEMTEVLTAVCGVLNKIGAVVNKSCGLHVHFDMRDTLSAYRDIIYAKLYRALPLLTQIVPESRRNNTYCKRNKRVIPNYNGSRYKMINATSYYKHHTFEIRLFNSTTNASKIINWITLLQGIINGAVLLRSPSSFKNAAKHWKMDKDLLAWAEARKLKFAGSSQDTNEVPTPEVQGDSLDVVVIDENPNQLQEAV